MFEKTGELPEGPLDRAIVEYYNAFDDAKTDSGFLNFDLLDDVMTELKEYAGRMLSEKHTGLAEHTPLAQEFLDDRKTIQESGYFDIVRDKMQFHGLTTINRQYMALSDKIVL